jgi:chromosome segregation ATPase
MADEQTTKPMLEALLEGQRQLATQMSEMRTLLTEMRTQVTEMRTQVTEMQTQVTAIQTALVTISERQDALAARQDRLEVRVTELISRVEDGFDDTTRKIEIFNDRLLSFETWLKKVDRRLHDEILVRTR